MKENNAGLKSNLKKVDSHAISPAEYAEIPELPEEFFTEGQLYRNGKPMERRSRDKQKEPTKHSRSTFARTDQPDCPCKLGKNKDTSLFFE